MILCHCGYVYVMIVVEWGLRWVIGMRCDGGGREMGMGRGRMRAQSDEMRDLPAAKAIQSEPSTVFAT